VVSQFDSAQEPKCHIINYPDTSLKHSSNFSNSDQADSTRNITLNPHETFQFSSQNFQEISIDEKCYYPHLYVYIFILVLVQDKIEF